MHLYYLGIVGRGSLEALNRAVADIRFSFEKKNSGASSDRRLEGNRLEAEQLGDCGDRKELLWISILLPSCIGESFHSIGL